MNESEVTRRHADLMQELEQLAASVGEYAPQVIAGNDSAIIAVTKLLISRSDLLTEKVFWEYLEGYFAVKREEHFDDFVTRLGDPDLAFPVGCDADAFSRMQTMATLQQSYFRPDTVLPEQILAELPDSNLEDWQLRVRGDAYMELAGHLDLGDMLRDIRSQTVRAIAVTACFVDGKPVGVSVSANRANVTLPDLSHVERARSAYEQAKYLPGQLQVRMRLANRLNLYLFDDRIGAQAELAAIAREAHGAWREEQHRLRTFELQEIEAGAATDWVAADPDRYEYNNRNADALRLFPQLRSNPVFMEGRAPIHS